jgi:hypothetical protein
MDVEVVVLGAGSTEAMLRWTVREPAEAGAGPWRQLALDLVRRARQGQSGGEVFLCYRGERPEEYYDHALLERLVTLGRQHAWGAPVHLVLDRRDRIPTALDDYRDSLEEWLATALRLGVADVLQVLMDPSGREPVDPLLLRSACDRARAMGEVLAAAGQDVWEVALTGKSRQREKLRRFLAPLVRANGRADPGSRLLVVLHDYSDASHWEAVATALELFEPTGAMVATVGVNPDKTLWESCRDRHLDLVRFRGVYELLYFLRRRLPGAARGPRQPRPAGDELTYYEDGLTELVRRIPPGNPGHDRMLTLEGRLRENIRKARGGGDTAVQMHDRARILDPLNRLSVEALGTSFNSLCSEAAVAAVDGEEGRGPEGGGDLLLTTSLDPDSQAELCLLAAQIVHRLLWGLPPAVVPRVHLALTRAALGDMIDGMSAIAGWIFLGTAAGERGLPEAPAGEVRAAEEWSDCFGRLGPGLPLAMFVAADSGAVARRFAGSGTAGCAVYFSALAHDAVAPARRVLHALLAGGDRAEIAAIVGNGARGGAFFAEDR